MQYTNRNVFRNIPKYNEAITEISVNNDSQKYYFSHCKKRCRTFIKF